MAKASLFAKHRHFNINQYTTVIVPLYSTQYSDMDQDINYQQAFIWAIELTAQLDYQSVTHVFLKFLQQLPFVTTAEAYEIYGNRNQRSGQASNIDEQLIRRFPLDFSNQEVPANNELLQEINATYGFKASKPDAEGFFSQAIATIRNVKGPDRAVILYGKFNDQATDLLSNAITLYSNQVALHDSKERDVLTRLPNRQSFNARVLQVCEYFRNRPPVDRISEKSSWLAILDIDHFKRVNDNFGHLVGDQVLLLFSQLLEKHFRFNDFLFRFGGEEFVVILNLVTQKDAEATFDRFRKVIANFDFPEVGKITVSVGAAHINNAIMSATLLDRADKALYYSKEHGRNSITLYENIAESLYDNIAFDLFE